MLGYSYRYAEKYQTKCRNVVKEASDKMIFSQARSITIQIDRQIISLLMQEYQYTDNVIF